MLKIATLTAFILTGAITATLTPRQAKAHDTLSAQNKAEIQKLIGEYLNSNPKQLAKALDNMQDYYRAESERQMTAAVEALKPQIINDSRDKYIGNKGAENVIVEFYDYNCSYCRKNFADLQSLLSKRDDVLFIFKELPILSETSQEAAGAALAIASTQNYNKFHELLMTFEGRLTSNDIFKALQKVGENPATILTYAKSKGIQQHISDNQKLAQELGISGTPSFYINGKIYEGLIEEKRLAAILDE